MHGDAVSYAICSVHQLAFPSPRHWPGSEQVNGIIESCTSGYRSRDLIAADETLFSVTCLTMVSVPISAASQKALSARHGMSILQSKHWSVSLQRAQPSLADL